MVFNKRNPPSVVSCTKEKAWQLQTEFDKDMEHGKLLRYERDDIAHCGGIGELDTKM